MVSPIPRSALRPRVAPECRAASESWSPSSPPRKGLESRARRRRRQDGLRLGIRSKYPRIAKGLRPFRTEPDASLMVGAARFGMIVFIPGRKHRHLIAGLRAALSRAERRDEPARTALSPRSGAARLWGQKGVSLPAASDGRGRSTRGENGTREAPQPLSNPPAAGLPRTGPPPLPAIGNRQYRPLS